MRADLHIHSTYSDGSANIASILRYAAKERIDCIALSDHDTLTGVDEALGLGAAAGIQVIPAVEMTTVDAKRGRPAHLLCYLPRERGIITGLCQSTIEKRIKQKERMVQKLSALYPICWEEVLHRAKDSASVHESHIMMVLADMGYTGTVIGGLAKELLYKGGRCYVPSDYPDIREALAAVRKSAGVAVLAHPGQFDSLELARELAQEGLLDGVEVWHPRNAEDTQRQLIALSNQYGLIMTGGSDFHGSFAASPHPVGYCTCPAEQVKRLLSLAAKRERQ